MSGPGVVVTLPSGSIFTSYYTVIDALTDAQGNPTNAITPNEGTVTISGITDAGPASGSTIQVALFGYEVDAGLPEETSVVAKTAMVSATDLHETDSQGNELYSWSASLSTTGLASGLYALQSFSYVPGYVETNGVPVPLTAYEDDQGTVTIDEFVPFTYVVRADTEIVSVGTAQSTVPIYLPNANGSVQLSSDGRYVVWISGDEYEEDLQTGATIDLTTTGDAAPGLQTTLAPTLTPVGHPDPYGPEYNAGYSARNYPSFTEGGVTFGTTPDFDFNANDGTENPLPTVTDANGDTEVLAPFGIDKVMTGYAAAASDNGNAVLTVESSDVTYFSPYGSDSSDGTSASPEYYVVYRSPAPRLTLDPVNGSYSFRASGTVTLTGTSDAIGQTVEIDFGQAGAEAGTATVLADGSWSFSFDASTITGTSLFIEASVMSAAGTPAEVSQTAQITDLPLPTVTAIKGSVADNGDIFGPTETLTIKLDTSEAVYVTGTPILTLSNGEDARYAGGSGTDELDFYYVPSIQDSGSSDLAVTGLDLPSGDSIDDALGDPLSGPFTQALGLQLLTAPEITGLSPTFATGDVITNSTTPTITVDAEEDETITLYDNGVVIGTGTTPDYGYPGVTFTSITPTAPLPEGQSTLTATAVDSSGYSSAVSDPVTITVDTIPPGERILSLAINGTDTVDLAHQAALSIAITGRLDSPLQAGESVMVMLPNGDTQTVTPAAGVTGFTVVLNAYDAAAFGVSGTISAYVEDEAGNIGAVTSQAFTADSLRLITLVSGDPADPSQSNEAQPAISGDGRIVAFEASQQTTGDDAVTASDDDSGLTQGIYLKTLSTGAVTLAAADGESPSLSDDGTVLAYVGDTSYPSQVYVRDFTTGAVTLVSANGGTAGDAESYDPTLSGDGTKVAFVSSADNLVAGVGTGQSNLQVYVATLSGGAVASLDAITVAPSDGSQGNGTSQGAALSADGSEVVFTSDATNLLAAGDTHTANLGGFNQQVYVKALTDNAASGLQAGQVELVTGTADGSVGDGTNGGVSLSADGRYVVFSSAADNLAPSNLAPGTTLPAGVSQVYVKDLLTGTLSLVSQTPNGVVGDGFGQSPSISADGKTIVFSDNADNFGAGAGGTQIYEATLSAGVVTGLTLVSEPGAIPGDGSSEDPSLSSDGTTVAFQSTAGNLASGSPAGDDPNHVYTTTITPGPTGAAPVTLTVTNTNDSGAGSLRAALAAAHDGDTIIFAPSIAGGTITLASTLTVDAGVTIDGLGSTITVSGNTAVTVFDVAITSDATALIEGLTIKDGAGTGGGGAGATGTSHAASGAVAAGGVDLSAGVLTLLQDDFVGNVATGGVGGDGTEANTTDLSNEDGAAGGDAGGAIAVGTGARLFASDLTLSNNTATGGTGGRSTAKATGGGGGAAGGAIYVGQAATVSLDGLTLNDNSSTGGLGGEGGDDGEGTGGAGGPAGGAVYVAGEAAVAANGLTFSDSTATGGTGGPSGGGNAPLGYKGSGVGGNAAGAIYVDPATSFTPFNFTYSGDSAATGTDGNGDPGTSGGGGGIYATAFTDTNLGTASVPGPPPGSTGEDGYIVGATVSYENGSGTPVTTDALGGFTLTGGTGPIMLTGGTDSATGLAFTGTLTAPADSTVISPLTTLVEAVAEAAGDTSAAGIASANARVLASLSLPGDLDLTTFDAEGALFGTGLSADALVAATRVFAADNYLESAERMITAAGGSAPATIAAIAQTLAAGQTPDLTDPATLFANAGLSSAATTALVDIATATLSAVETQIDHAVAPGTAFDDISGGSIADQRDAAGLLTTAAQSGTDAAFQAAASSFTAGLPQTLATDDAQVPCFAAGTRIRTPRGDVPVEALAEGDAVVTIGGEALTIRWIGHRTVDCARHARPASVLPVRIAPGAFGPGLPARPLLLSPDHAVFAEDVLIPVKYLVNGTTVAQRAVASVTYFHIELPEHAVILAEGLPAESYLDTGDRVDFANGGAAVTLHPVWGTEARDVTLIHDALGAAPLCVAGPEVDRVRALLAAAMVTGGAGTAALG